MAQCKTRSGTVLFKIKDLVFKERKYLDLSKAIQVPSMRYVIERVYTIKKEDVVKTGVHHYALREVAFELQELRIFLNLQPKSHSQIQIDIKKLVAEAEKLKRYPVSKQAGVTFQNAYARGYHGYTTVNFQFTLGGI